MVQTATLRTYQRGDRVYITAQQLWLILTGFVMWAPSKGNKKLLTYGELALKAGYGDTRAGHLLGRQLGILGNFCLQNGFPALNSIVVTQHSGKPGDEVVHSEKRTVSEEQRAVLSFDWNSVACPTTGMLRKVWDEFK